MGRVIHFEIHAQDPERAARFYHAIFGWMIEEWKGSADYWLITTGDANMPGINGAIVRRKGSNPAADNKLPVTGFVCTIEVENIDVSIQNVQDRGCPIVVSKQTVPGIGWMAYGKDTEGNIFGMMQNDETAQ